MFPALKDFRNQFRRGESRLFVLDDADLGGAQHAAVELEALGLDVEDGVVLLAGLGRHEGGLVLVGVELVALGLEALEAVPLERLHEDRLGHLDALVQGDEVRVAVGAELVGGDGGEGAVEVVDAVDEVLGELLDGEVAGALDLALGAVLEVAEVGDGAEALVLGGESACGSYGERGRVLQIWGTVITDLPLPGLGLLGLELLLQLSDGVSLAVALALGLLCLGALGSCLLRVAVPPHASRGSGIS